MFAFGRIAHLSVIASALFAAMPQCLLQSSMLDRAGTSRLDRQNRRGIAVALSFRQTEILDIARSEGRVIVDQLADRFGVTLQTIRRDLADLSDAGLLDRVYGSWWRMKAAKSWWRAVSCAGRTAGWWAT